MSPDSNNAFVLYIKGLIQHFNHSKYFRYRECVINPGGQIIKTV